MAFAHDITLLGLLQVRACDLCMHEHAVAPSLAFHRPRAAPTQPAVHADYATGGCGKAAPGLYAARTAGQGRRLLLAKTRCCNT
jgi:hypothetical protein